MRHLSIRAACLTILLASSPAIAGPIGSGQIIYNTVYNTVVKQDITDVAVDALNQQLALILGDGGVLAPPPASNTLAQFQEQNTGLLADQTNLFNQTQSQIHNDLYGVYASIPTLDYQVSPLTHTGQDTLWLAPTVTQVLDGTTSTDQVTRSYTESPGAIVIGDPMGDLADVIVVAGTLTVTDTDTTIETQHITRTTTNNYNLVDNFQFGATRVLAAAPVPEPGTLWLLAAGLLGLMGLKRRRT